MTSDKEGFDVLRPRGDEQFIFAFEQTSQNDATFARAFELVDAKEFDQLVDHLRAHGTKAYVKDERLIHRVAACGMPAIGAINLLVEAGADTYDVLRMAAVHGHVDLLQVAYERGYQPQSEPVDPVDFGMGHLLYFATGKGTETSALKVIRWALEVKDTYFEYFDDTYLEDYANALRNTLQKEYIDAAACLLDNHEDFGLPELTYTPLATPVVDKREEIEGVANKGAVRSLDFLCQRWGVEFVTNTVRKAALRDDYEDKIRRWLRKRTRSTVTVHLERAMSLIDEHKLTLPEGAYIGIVTEIGNAYKKARN